VSRLLAFPGCDNPLILLSNFHNYTLAKSFNDRSCNRYMIDIDVAEPVEHNGMEWLSVKIHGQSFMLHQIVSLVFTVRHACLTVLLQRKMISMAVLAARTKTPASLIPKTFGKPSFKAVYHPLTGFKAPNRFTCQRRRLSACCWSNLGSRHTMTICFSRQNKTRSSIIIR
jgi:hypothetical protein